MIQETLKHCRKCGFAYVILDSSKYTRSSVEIDQCLIDGNKLEQQLPEKVLATTNYLTTEKYDTSYYYIVYPKIKLAEVIAFDESDADIIQSYPYEERINNQIKEEFINQKVEKSKEAPDYKGHAGWEAYNGRAIGGFGFKLENHSLRIIHYTGQAHSQMSVINIESIFSIDLGFVPQDIVFNKNAGKRSETSNF